jgi:hypothetical protein
MTTHAGLAGGRWATLSLVEQLANVGSEVNRAHAAWMRQRPERFERALARALELFDLTARDDRWHGHRRREILRAREEFCRLFFDDTSTRDAERTLLEYFLRFATLARRQAGLGREPRIPRRETFELPGAPRCWVCLQLEDAERSHQTQQLIAIIGAAAYAVCPKCGQESPDLYDEAYRTRVSQFMGALES